METINMVLIDHFCSNCGVDISFVTLLNDYGIVDITVVNDKKYISNEQLKKVERALYFHNELNINMEGIDVIHHLLHQIGDLQEELRIANNKLDLLDYK